ncbi:hypothetical protein [Thiocapsa bogorovii]|uniref:hypothetical protein n=1 Tax=Thiocapsa bogorovii TaxID=521689 RepID=UPI001E366526|nr:hypothetical protein [Thiocapsa bogorovii]UHD14941.1 hypothetical protein LT988_16865 [Thiocapsa bogorovii]
MRITTSCIAAATILTALLAASPVGATVTVIGDFTHEHVARPGERYRGTIVLRNDGSAPGEVKLYQTDYSFAADGSTDYGQAGQLPRSNAGWVRLSRDLVTVPASGTERIDYEVQVPTGGGLKGTYWSMVMVEAITQASPEASADVTVQLTHSVRYGVQIVTQVGRNDDAAGLSFTNPGLVREDGKRVFVVDVENTGQRWLRPGLSLELYSQSGTPVGKFQGTARRLYPGTSVRFKMDLGDIPNGSYLGLVVADGTGDNLFGANVELEIE